MCVGNNKKGKYTQKSKMGEGRETSEEQKELATI